LEYWNIGIMGLNASFLPSFQYSIYPLFLISNPCDLCALGG
jgi:hypothetical protein